MKQEDKMPGIDPRWHARRALLGVAICVGAFTSFGPVGRAPGQFFGVHNFATDSKGNLYTAETYTEARVQLFIVHGIGNVAREQGTVWPTR